MLMMQASALSMLEAVLRFAAVDCLFEAAAASAVGAALPDPLVPDLGQSFSHAHKVRTIR